MKKRWISPLPLNRWALYVGVAILSIQLVAAQQVPTPKNTNQRMAPGLQQHLRNSQAVRVQVKNKAQFLSWLTEKGINTNIQQTRSEHIITLRNLSEKALQQLATCPYVTYIDKADRRAVEEIELKDADFSINTIYAALGAYPQLNGQNMAASVKEGAFNPNDLDLKGRAIAPEAFAREHSIHATTMATIIAGAGNSGPRGKGIAPYARLGYSDFAELFPDNSQNLLSKGIHLQNHSYGVGLENYYGLESAAYDRETFEHPTLLHVFSSGNSGDKADVTGTYAGITGFANLTGQFKNSKNSVSVGALNPDGKVGPLSSKGPAQDGRVKPELVALGKGGTSEAAAVASGVALLVQQAYQQQHNQLPPAALVKAALINSADDTGRPEVDHETGFGNIDALGAIRTIKQNRFLTGSVSQSTSQLHTITVPEGVQLLKATLVWHDAPGSPEITTALVNDLDLELVNTTTGQIWKPWVLSTYPHPDSLKLPAKRRPDHLNNVEQITLATPEPGTYQLKVSGYNVTQSTQNYSLAFEHETGAEWVYPVAGQALEANAANRIRWQGAVTGPVTLAYKLAGTSEWQPIANNIQANATYFDWQAPAIAGILQLKLTSNSGTIISDEFVLGRQLKLNVGYNCTDKVMLHWAKIPGVTNYQVWQVGATHPELLLTTPDTLLVLSKGQTTPEYLSVAPVIAGTTASYSDFVAYNQIGIGCYIRSFLPEQFVAEQAQLQLELSTLYQVASLSLERIAGNTYKTISSVSPVTQLNYKLSDPTPDLGKNLYRVKVTTTAGQTFYSQTEELIYTNKNYIQVYPNPVLAGQPFSVIVSGDEAIVQLYDQLGKLVYSSEEFGAIKEIPTSKLQRGLYIVRLHTPTGNVVAGKVLVL